MPHDSIVLLGVNHKSTPLEIREKLALSEGYKEPLAALGTLQCLNEYFLVSTCNRVEVLFTCNDLASAKKQVLACLFGYTLSDNAIEKYVYQYVNESAVKHLFKVASSLDSMIVGETQILGQLKEAFRFSSDQKTSGFILNRLLHKSFSVAKRVRSETKIGANAVSISYAAVELARKIFGQLNDKKVLLVGAGEMAELAAEHLVAQGVKEVVVANRTLERAVQLARRFHGRAVSLAELIEQLIHVDIIISSTGATDIILTKEEVKPVMPGRRNKPLFFIDIAVPRDLDPKINELDNIYLYDIDDLHNVVEMNKTERDKEAIKAQRIVDEETIKFRQWLDKLEVTPTIIDLRNMADAICAYELEKSFNQLKKLDDKDKKSIEKMAQAIAAKMLHNPLQYLKNDNGNVNRSLRINTIRDLFKLNN